MILAAHPKINFVDYNQKPWRSNYEVNYRRRRFIIFPEQPFAAQQWKTPLCRELFDVTRSDATYNTNERVINTSVITLDTLISGQQGAQILMFYYDGFSVPILNSVWTLKMTLIEILNIAPYFMCPTVKPIIT